MRRTVAIVLVGAGAALLVLGLALRLVAYPRLAVAPYDQVSTSTSIGQDMSVLQIRETGVEVLTGVTVTSVRKVNGNVAVAKEKGDGRSVFWETSVESSGPNGVLSASVEGISFDRVSGQATNCCGDYVEVEEGKPVALEHKGVFFKFPFDTQRADYLFWDLDLREATPAAYAGQQTIEGLRTYRFVQRIPDTVLQQREVPGSLFQPGLTGNVTADLVYANTRSLWVEPNTGVIIKGQEEQNKRLVWNGIEVPATVGTIAYSPQTISDNVDAYGPKGTALGLLHGNVTALAALLGALLLLAGLVLFAAAFGSSRRGRRVADGSDPSTEVIDVPDTQAIDAADGRNRADGRRR